MAGLEDLAEADGVGHRDQFDAAFQLPGGFQLRQALLEFPGGAHARQFVGMQAGLDVDLALAGTEAEHAQPALAAKAAPGQRMIDSFHAVLLSACAGPGRPGSGARPS
ncbi:hypothetical protein D9M71_841420 [compost metagenome]